MPMSPPHVLGSLATIIRANLFHLIWDMGVMDGCLFELARHTILFFFAMFYSFDGWSQRTKNLKGNTSMWSLLRNYIYALCPESSSGAKGFLLNIWKESFACQSVTNILRRNRQQTEWELKGSISAAHRAASSRDFLLQSSNRFVRWISCKPGDQSSFLWTVLVLAITPTLGPGFLPFILLFPHSKITLPGRQVRIQTATESSCFPSHLVKISSSCPFHVRPVTPHNESCLPLSSVCLTKRWLSGV